MKLPDFVLRWIGKKIASEIDLKEASQMDSTKKWYQSKSIWTGVVAVLIGLYGLLQANLIPTLPPIPEWVFTILGAVGIYTRVVATDKIG